MTAYNAHHKDNCTATDLFTVSCGVQCGNCMAIVIDHCTPDDGVIILKKMRTPAAIHTPESHTAAGRPALAADMRASKIKRELEYIVGRHAYFVQEYENGQKSRPRRIF